MTIPELIEKAKGNDCNISITAGRCISYVEIRLSKDGYTIMRCIPEAELLNTEIDLIAYYMANMISEVKLGNAKNLSIAEENMKLKAKLKYASDLITLLDTQVGVGVEESLYDCHKLISDWRESEQKT